MKAPELKDLIKESHPSMDICNQIQDEEFIIQVINRLYQLEKENTIIKEENITLKKEIQNLNQKTLKDNYDNKTNITLYITQINNLKEENEKYKNLNDEMKKINQKLCEDNKILMAHLDKNITDISKLTIQENNREIWGNGLKNLLQEKEKEIVEMKLNLVESEDKLKKLYDDNKRLNDMNKNLKFQIDKMENERQISELKFNEMIINIKNLENEIVMKNKDIQLLEQELKKFNSKNKEYDEENNKLNQLNLELKAQNDEIIEKMNKQADKIAFLEHENESKLNEMKDINYQINELEKNCKELKQDNINLTKQNEIVVNNNNELLALINEIKVKNDFIYNKYDNLKLKIDSIENLFQKEEDLENILAEFKKDISNIPDNYDNNPDNKQFYKTYNEKSFDDYLRNNIIDNSINEINSNSMRNYIKDVSNCHEEMTMDKKYDFLSKYN